MPISVPNSPKVLTTKYQNWRGVDYTNDPSNVWYRRSPNGLNMLPNLDGQPFKRHGWKVEFIPDDFADAMKRSVAEYDATKDYFKGDFCTRTVLGGKQLYYCKQNITAEAWDGSHWTGIDFGNTITQYKVDYFELGGTEYLWFYTEVGCFYYGDSLVYVDRSYQIDDDKPYEYSIGMKYEAGDYCRHEDNGEWKPYRCKTAISTPGAWDSTKWSLTDASDCSTVFPPMDQSTGKRANIDYSKSFFFEGGGRAGYYLFADNKMYWFDGEKLHEAKPTIPVVITMAEATGVGTMLQEVNMLTEFRAIDYLCDGTTTTYMIPDGVESLLNAYTINADGTYTPNYNWEMQNNGEIKFTPAPAKISDNEPSLRIIYSSANATISEKSATTSAYELVIKRETTDITTQKYVSGQWVDYATGYSEASYSNAQCPTIPLANAKKPISLHIDARAGTAQADAAWDLDASNIVTGIDAYGSSATVSAGASDRWGYGKELWERYPSAREDTGTTTTYTEPSTSFGEYIRSKLVTHTWKVTVQVRARYTQWDLSVAGGKSHRNAFFASSKSLVYGNGIINQAFLTASKFDNYTTRVWYSMATDPLYFPDTNYIEVGATDKKIMGLIKVGDYLGVIKQGGSTDTSVYLAYATSFEDITTYAVKQSVNGIGAISNGAFNILNGEPLFLSAEGVMGIEPSEDESRTVRNRSYYINKKLLAEPSLQSAFSFVHNGMYWLGVNGHCYVLDGSQKSSWENTKTNLQYECYYLDNIPAKCFAKKDGKLWFIDKYNNLCRFKADADAGKYADEYVYEYDMSMFTEKKAYLGLVDPVNMQIPADSVVSAQMPTTDDIEWNDTLRDTLYNDGITFTVSGLQTDYPDIRYLVGIKYTVTADGTTYESSYWYPDNLPATDVTIPPGESFFEDIPEVTESATYKIGVYYFGEHEAADNDIVFRFYATTHGDVPYNDQFYTITSIAENVATVQHGVPVKAVWGTIADDDGSAHYYKNLQKKGSVVSLMPMSNNGVNVYIIPDEKERVFVGETTAGNHVLPFNYYLRKKIKKYKRLQIVCENDTYDCGFGVDEIIKSYTLGNYAKR